MEMSAVGNAPIVPRFKVADKEIIYKLFDAFVKKTLVENKAIDFTKPAVFNADGSIEFATLEQIGEKELPPFSEMICGTTIERFDFAAAPEMKRGELQADYEKRKKEYESANKEARKKIEEQNISRRMYVHVVENIVGDTIDKIKAPEAPKLKDGMDAAEKERLETEYKLEQKAYEKGLRYGAAIRAHLHWLWTLGMEGIKTFCGDFDGSDVGDDLVLAECWDANLAGYNKMDGVWFARSFIYGDPDEVNKVVDELFSLFVEKTNSDDKKLRKEWVEFTKALFKDLDFKKLSQNEEECRSNCRILDDFFAQEEKPKKTKASKKSENSDEPEKPRKESVVKASKFAENFKKKMLSYVNKKGYKDTLSKYRKKDMQLMYHILERISSLPTRPQFKNMEDAKEILIHYVFKTNKDSDAPVRNGLLHLCNPDRYINMYLYEEKVELVESHSGLLRSYNVSNYAGFQRQDCLYFSKKWGTKDDRVSYLANRTEEKICFIFDEILKTKK